MSTQPVNIVRRKDIIGLLVMILAITVSLIILYVSLVAHLEENGSISSLPNPNPRKVLKSPPKLLSPASMKAVGIYRRLLSGSFDESGETDKNSSARCRVPKLDPFDPSILEMVSKIPEPLNCHHHESYPFLFNSSVIPYPHLTPAKTLLEMRAFGIRRCFYEKITRRKDGDERYNVREVKKFRVSLDGPTRIPVGHEFIVISCDIRKQGEKVTDDDPSVETVRKIVDLHAFVHVKSEKKQRRLKTRSSQSSKFNVIILGLDTMSRMSFLRTMPGSYVYLMEELGAVEMTGYHKRGSNTFPNILPMLTNLPAIDETRLECEVDRTFDACPFIWKKYSKAGYKTLFAEDVKTISLLNNNKAGFSQSPTDYYLRAFLTAAEDLIGHRWVKLTKSCFGPRPAFQIMLDYMQKMSYVMKHSQENYFQFTWSCSTTHYIENAGRLLDSYLINALQWWKEGGYLDDTFLVFMSDHGYRSGKLYQHYQGQLEDRLPFMYLVAPPTFKEKYREAFENLVVNKDRIITGVDLHQTLLDILNLDRSKGKVGLERTQHSPDYQPYRQLTTGISLFRPIAVTRKCSDAEVPESYCTCNRKMKPMLVYDFWATTAAEFAVFCMNKKLFQYKRCAWLALDKINQAAEINFGETHKRNAGWQAYQVSFQTTPGDATFQAFLLWDGLGRWSVSGEIARTNWYGNQSYCVSDIWAKYHCYCLEEPVKEKVMSVDPKFFYTEFSNNNKRDEFSMF